MGRNTGLPEELASLRFDAEDAAAGRWPEDTGCGLLHVDMDAFFAAVELRTRPDLVHRPVVVAGAGPRSVVLSANYHARQYGVRSAMPVGAARKLCPQAVYLPPTRGSYAEVSRGVMAIFRELTPLVEPLSLDEAFLDVSGALRRLGSTPARIGAEIRRRVEAEHGITCSVGVASVKFVAKLASGMAKPDGMVVVPPDQTLAFLHRLPVSALWGVGKRTEEKLRQYGLETIADVARTPITRLRKAVGAAVGDHLHALANGHDDRTVRPEHEEKSIGAEHTFDTDQADRAVLGRELLRLADRVAATLRDKGLRARTVSIKVRFADFRTITRARTLLSATDVGRDLYKTAVALLAEEGTAPVRLIGVRAEGLAGDADGEQLSFHTDEPRWRDAELAADVARSKFGLGAIRPASLLTPGADKAK